MGEILLLTGGLFFVFCLGCVVVNHVLLLFIPRNVLGGLYLCLGLLELIPEIAILSRPGYNHGRNGALLLPWLLLQAAMILFGFWLLTSKDRRVAANAGKPQAAVPVEDTRAGDDSGESGSRRGGGPLPAYCEKILVFGCKQLYELLHILFAKWIF